MLSRQTYHHLHISISISNCFWYVFHMKVSHFQQIPPTFLHEQLQICVPHFSSSQIQEKCHANCNFVQSSQSKPMSHLWRQQYFWLLLFLIVYGQLTDVRQWLHIQWEYAVCFCTFKSISFMFHNYVKSFFLPLISLCNTLRSFPKARFFLYIWSTPKMFTIYLSKSSIYIPQLGFQCTGISLPFLYAFSQSSWIMYTALQYYPTAFITFKWLFAKHSHHEKFNCIIYYLLHSTIDHYNSHFIQQQFHCVTSVRPSQNLPPRLPPKQVQHGQYCEFLIIIVVIDWTAR